jgi:hypothetical protein
MGPHAASEAITFNQFKILIRSQNDRLNFSFLKDEQTYGKKIARNGPNVSTTPLRQWGFRQCLPLSWTTLRDKHCRHPIAVMGVVDTFGYGRTTKLFVRDIHFETEFT